MATYLGLTTTNSEMLGYHIVAIGDNREEVEAARPDPSGGVYDETEHVNFFVTSISAARRRFGSGAVEGMLENFVEDNRRIERMENS